MRLLLPLVVIVCAVVAFAAATADGGGYQRVSACVVYNGLQPPAATAVSVTSEGRASATINAVVVPAVYPTCGPVDR